MVWTCPEVNSKKKDAAMHHFTGCCNFILYFLTFCFVACSDFSTSVISPCRTSVMVVVQAERSKTGHMDVFKEDMQLVGVGEEAGWRRMIH